MEYSSSWEANSRSDSQDITRTFWNPKVHYRVHKSHQSLSRATLIQSSPSNPISLKLFWILFSHLLLDLPVVSSLGTYQPCILHVPHLLYDLIILILFEIWTYKNICVYNSQCMFVCLFVCRKVHLLKSQMPTAVLLLGHSLMHPEITTRRHGGKYA
jgi:hypothetical protein